MPGGMTTAPPNKGLLESPLCTEHADYQAEFQQTRQKKELHAQINQRLTSKIHPGQSFPWLVAQLTPGSADAANPRLCTGSPRLWEPCTFGVWCYQNPKSRCMDVPIHRMSSQEQRTATAKGFLFSRQESAVDRDTLGRGFLLPCSPKWAETKII